MSEGNITNLGNIFEEFETKSVFIFTHFGGKKQKENSMWLQKIVGRDNTPELLDELALRDIFRQYGIHLLKLRRYGWPLIEECWEMFQETKVHPDMHLD